jgi:hyaluronoglucosaminidase
MTIRKLADMARGFFGGIDIVSTDPSRTTLGVRGTEAGLGTAKISHEPSAPGAADPNAAVLSLRTEGAGTAAQGIFLDAPSGSTGKALNFRQKGVEYLTLTPPDPVTGAPAVLRLNGKKVVTEP